MLMFYKETDITVAWNCNTTCFVFLVFCFFFSSWQNQGNCVKYYFPPFVYCHYEDEITKSEPATHLYVCFFLSVWFYVGMAGAFCFILIQLVLLIDFAHSWNESWVEKMEEGNSRCWYAGKPFVLQSILKIDEL